MTKHILKHYETNELKLFTMEEMLEEVNRDRSEDWLPYNEFDYQEGVDMFTDWVYIGKIENVEKETK